MINACPACGAVYNVTPKDIGRRLKCKKCGAAIVITELGIEADEGVAASASSAASTADEPVEPAVSVVKKPRRNLNLGGGAIGFMEQFRGTIATFIFGFGAFLVIFHLFMPLIAQAKVARRSAFKAEAERLYQEEVDRINKNKDLKDKDKLLEDLRKEHEAEMKDYDRSIASAETARKTSSYWDYYFMMFGFLAVMVGSLMFMMPGQPTVKRVVGAIVITAQMLLVFMTFLGRSTFAD